MNTSPIRFTNAILGWDFKTLALFLHEYLMLFISIRILPVLWNLIEEERKNKNYDVINLWNLHKKNSYEFPDKYYIILKFLVKAKLYSDSDVC